MSISTALNLFDSISRVPARNRFAQLLRSGRENLGLSIEDVAMRCDVDPSLWAALECGQQLQPGWEELEPSLALLERIGNAIDIDPAVLMIVSTISVCARRYGLN